LAKVAAIKPLIAQIKALDGQIATAISEHPDGEILVSLLKRSFITAAELLAEIGDCRAPYPTRDALGDAGQAAVAIDSGKRKAACFRWGCNKRLRGAFCTLGGTTRDWHPWAQAFYAAARQRGHDHPARCAPSAGPGAASCGAAGKTAPHMTRPATRPRNSTARSRSRPQGAPRPDLAATQRMLSAAVTDQAARRAEREALDGKPTPSTHPDVDTGHLVCRPPVVFDILPSSQRVAHSYVGQAYGVSASSLAAAALIGLIVTLGLQQRELALQVKH
jgi:hypothetical protein